MQDLSHFFESPHFIEQQESNTYEPLQLGATIQYAVDGNFDWEDADIVIIGCGEQRGATRGAKYSNAPDAIREELYKMYSWHPAVKIVDAGNIREGANIYDTKAALRTVLHELQEAGKTAIVLGGAHDLTMQQYEAFKKSKKLVQVTVADMLIDLEETEETTDKSFLMEMLTEQPNFIRHFNHIGFQSYYVNPRMLETLDKLRFDCYRLGRVREHFEDVEPVLRNSDLFSFDMTAIKYSDAPINKNGSPNGFTGDEACILTRYAGMGTHLHSFGIYGYTPDTDEQGMTAKLASQMIWYFIDGYHIRKTEAELTDHEEFISFHVTFTEIDTIFLKSKRTNRWWMRLPDNTHVPCSYNDYLLASSGEIPERWLREQERLV
ncbi:MAG: arginase [Bacteroidetes bacterium 43-93]|nr:formimidoylglutamase [Bacteroidota bacterium]OJW97650.1 MAG: arginase [Bacteroidetes bacterium 43-93]